MNTVDLQFELEAAAPICANVPRGHVFAEALQRFRSDIAAWLHARGETLEPMAREHQFTRTLMRATRAADGAWALDWVYFSAQYSSPERFRARTFIYRKERRKTSIWEFPDDSKLASLAAYLRPFTMKKGGQTVLGTVRVLRYVPRRRFTFAASAPGPVSDRDVVGKIVRQSEADTLWRKLASIEERVAMGQPGFRISRLLSFDPENSLIFQTRQPGEDLASALSSTNYRMLLRQAGGVQAAIHQLCAGAETVWDKAGYVDRVARDVDWICLLFPDKRRGLQQVLGRWRKRAPDLNEADFVFCHGDFRAPHLLVEGQPWSVIDFDGCLRADAAWETAVFLTYLKRDVPFFSRALLGDESWSSLFDGAEQSYLEGYLGESRGSFSLARLTWFRVSTEIHSLARMLQRDQFHPVAFERTQQYIEALAEKLE